MTFNRKLEVSRQEANAAAYVTPKGKRSVHENIWGNIVGYVGGRRFREFGCTGSWTRLEAQAWLEGRENTEWWDQK